MLIDPAVAREKLILRNIYTESTAPTVGEIASMLEEVELLACDWLGYYPGRKEYHELLSSNNRGNLVTTNYPLLLLKGIKRPDLKEVNLIEPSTFNLHWQGELRTVNIGYADTRCWIIYEAGYDPLPSEIENGIWNALKTVLTSVSKDPALLNEFRGSERVIELPDGLKTEYFSPNDMGVSSSGRKGATELDRAMSVASKYRRGPITMSAGFD